MKTRMALCKCGTNLGLCRKTNYLQLVSDSLLGDKNFVVTFKSSKFRTFIKNCLHRDLNISAVIAALCAQSTRSTWKMCVALLCHQ